ncbi:MAG: YlmC/YmxH family sporulation protein [Clostridia bacterium]|nr:YlmC/YmxH family sporulation protein [Clostridia bacterium]
MKASELKQKEVINIKTGKRLGTIMDYDIDLRSGRITGVALPSSTKFSILSKPENDVFVPWEQIKKIGDDVILIETME